MSIHTRPALELIPAYRQGVPPLARPGVPSYKLSANENPYPPLPSVIEAVGASLAELHVYPDMSVPTLTSSIADRFGVGIEQVVFGAGSVEVASQIIHAVTTPGDEVIFAWRSFEAYPILTGVAGAVPVPVSLAPDFSHDLPAMLEAITPQTRLIFICSPNNPTGTIVDHQQLREFLSQVPADILVVIDEAYVHFDDVPNSARGTELFREFPNVALLHTFSKAYGLAGLRIGYAIAPTDVAANLRKCAIPFGVTMLAQRAAIASLEAEGELSERVAIVVSERKRMSAEIAALTVPVCPSGANFLWLPLQDRTEAVAGLLHDAGVSVRSFAGEGMRVTIGSQAANDRVLAVLRSAAEHLA